jgi:hypothetical protein
MKFQIIRFLFVGILFQLNCAVGQNFADLDFENAVIVPASSSPYYPYAVYASEALPGWMVGSGNYLGVSTINYDDTSLGATSVQLFGVDSQYSEPPLAGNFSIDLYGGVTSAAGASISQTAVVPSGAAAIEFIASGSSQFGALLVSLGGQDISYSAISVGPDFTTYAANIPPALADQIETLSFTATEGDNNYWEIDNIGFSPNSVPEPTTLVLAGLGVISVLYLRHKV